MNAGSIILEMALGLTEASDSVDRYRRLLGAMGRIIPFDGAALLRLDGEELVPVAVRGLSPDVMGRRYGLDEHPRLARACAAREPLLFPPDSALPDPFDGMLGMDDGADQSVHSCLACPLRSGGRLIGVMTADALRPGAFDGLDGELLSTVTAMAGAQMQTSLLMDALEEGVRRCSLVARDLVQGARVRAGSRLVGVGPAMEKLREDIELVARTDFLVLVTGETGTGKELVARAVHAESARRDEPLLYVNCAALPEALAESELFGHTKGAFTGAVDDRPGKFEVAHGGTLFLDEVGELPLSIQAKLLRVLQEGEIQRVGSDRTFAVDVRIIAATNRKLEDEVAAGRMREDLYHRLMVYPLRVPPLRERREDLPVLVGAFCDRARRQLGLGAVRMREDALAVLAEHDWPGNVRELENLVSRAVLRASAGVVRGEAVIVGASHLGGDWSAVREGSGRERKLGEGAASEDDGRFDKLGMRDGVRAFQRALILRALAETEGNWAAAARRLDMDRGNLHHLARRLGLK